MHGAGGRQAFVLLLQRLHRAVGHCAQLHGLALTAGVPARGAGPAVDVAEAAVNEEQPPAAHEGACVEGAGTGRLRSAAQQKGVSQGRAHCLFVVCRPRTGQGVSRQARPRPSAATAARPCPGRTGR